MIKVQCEKYCDRAVFRNLGEHRGRVPHVEWSHCRGIFFLCKDFVYLFLEKGEREKERERNIDQFLFIWLVCTPTKDWTCNPDICPDLESNWQCFSLQDDTQPTELHQSGLLNLEEPDGEGCSREREPCTKSTNVLYKPKR